LYIPFASDDDLAEIIRRRARALGWSLAEEVPAFLGRLSKGVPRQALRLLAASYRVTRSEGNSTIQVNDARRAVRLEGLDDRMGLTSQEQAYLHAVASGISRIGTIASRIAMPVTTVQRVVEPFLIRSGLLSKDEGRRELTSEGRDFVANSSAT
jgi:Holliday junction DNA helicase RuvB